MKKYKVISVLFFFLIFLFVSVTKANAFSCSSNGTGGGNFNIAATWTACNSTTPQTTDSITINSGDTVTLVAATTVTGITINSGGILAANTRALINTDGYTNNGSHTGTTSTMTLSGPSGTIINGNGSYSPTGVVTVSVGDKTVASGSQLSFPSITVTGVILTNNSTAGLSITTALSGTGTLTQGAGSILNLNGTNTVTTFDASVNSNEVHYTSTTANQTIKAGTYYNLFIEKSGRIGNASGTINVLGNLTDTAGTINFAGSTFTVTGNTNIFGILTDTSGGGAGGNNIFTGPVNVHIGASWNGIVGEVCDFHFKNGLVMNGTSFTSSTGVYFFETNNQSIIGSTSFTIDNLTVSGVNLTNSSTGTLTVRTALSGTGTFIQDVNSILKISGTSGITSISASANGNSVFYNGTTNQTIKAATYKTLDVSQNSGRNGSYIDADSSGTVTAGDIRVSIGNATFSGFGFSPGSVVASGNGDIGTAIVLPTGVSNLKKTGAAASTFVYGTNGAYVDTDGNGTVSIGDVRVAVGNITANGLGHAAASIVSSGNTDIGTAIVLPTGTNNLKKTGPANSNFTVGRDGAYVDTDSSGTVTAGDSRVAIGNDVSSGLGYGIGSIVASGDTDIGTIIVLPTVNLKKTGAAASAFVFGTDGAYIDADSSGTVTAGDSRVAIGDIVANGLGFATSSTVTIGDADIGTVIVLPIGTNNLKKTGSSGSTFVDNSLNITADTTVGTALVLGGNRLLTGTNKIILTSGTSLSRSAGMVVGNLQKHVNTGAASLTFEIGTGMGYTPVDINFGNVTSAGDLVATTFDSDDPNISTSSLILNKTANQYWVVTNSGTIFNNYGATVTFVPADVDASATTANFVLAKYDSGTWTQPTISSVTATSVTAIGMTSFSDFQVGESLIPSPTSSGSTGSTSGNSSSSNSNSTSICANSVTCGTPDLFEIRVNNKTAILYFSPPPMPYNYFYIDYSRKPDSWNMELNLI